MPAGPIRCPECGTTDFLVISTGVSYSDGTMIEHYRWPSRGEQPDGAIDEVLDAHALHDGGYEVEQSLVKEPELQSVEGTVKALCSGCLKDVTEQYFALGRAESLPV